VSASHAGSSTACDRRGLLVDLIEHQIDRLIPLFDVAPQAAVIQTAYRALCGTSLAIDPGACTPECSRINADGTPFQFALHLNATDPPALQFLGEASRPRCDPEERATSGFACLEQLGDILGLGGQVARVRPWLESWMQHRDAEPGASMAGALWFALAFMPGTAPALTVYLNNAWGHPSDRWRRLRALGDRLGATVDVEDSAVALTLAPLGAAVVLRGDARRSGRAYFSGFGIAIERYRKALSHATHGQRAGEAFDAFVHHLIGDEGCYPTRSSVYSHELSDTPSDSVKIELCAHCAFDDDRQAAARMSAWLSASRMGSDVYRFTLDALLGGRTLSTTGRPAVHSFVGVGVRRGEPYASIYLNPGPVVR
jgi:hypothetical protein